jgi:hypothetical protein
VRKHSEDHYPNTLRDFNLRWMIAVSLQLNENYIETNLDELDEFGPSMLFIS